MFSEYGDDSVAQLGGVHLACEQSSNVLTKILERGRLMSYLEQSTRYIPYDSRLPSGHYRYHRDQAVLESSLGARYVGEMDRMFDTYAGLLPALQSFVGRENPRHEGVSELTHRQAVRARCLDALRGLLPAGSLSNVGIFGSGQSYEQLLLRMRAHPLPEARRYADLILIELRKVIPSFLSRIDRPEHGGVWTEYLQARREETGAAVLTSCGRWRSRRRAARVTLTEFDPAGEDKVLVAMCYPYLNLAEEDIARHVSALGPEERRTIFQAYVGDRSNRRHRPGRALECTSYRFDIVADYGAFRDLQRHRMLTIEWQPLSTDLGFEVPPLVEAAGLSGSVPRVARTLQEPARRPCPLLSGTERLRGSLGFQRPFRVATERPRGDARPRVAVRSSRTSGLPENRPRNAPAHRRASRPPRDRRMP